MAEEDWRLLLDQYPPPSNSQGDPDADGLPEGDAPWQQALRAAALRARAGAPRSSGEQGRTPRSRKAERQSESDKAGVGNHPDKPSGASAAHQGHGTRGPSQGEQPPRPARTGDRVLITTLADTRGTVIALGDGVALVETRAARVRVALDELRVVEEGTALRGQPSRPTATLHLVDDLATHRVTLTGREGRKRARWPAIDLHGMALPDALERLDDFLYACWSEGHPAVAVIHGKGSGALRAAVQALLHEHPAVRHARPALHNAGGDGVTIVTL